MFAVSQIAAFPTGLNLDKDWIKNAILQITEQ